MEDKINEFDAERAEATHEYGDGNATEYVGFEDDTLIMAGRMDGEMTLSLEVKRGNEQIGALAWLTDEQAHRLGTALIMQAFDYNDE